MKFNPLGKTYHFRLSEDSCYMRMNDKCSLEDIDISDIKKIGNASHLAENSIYYCRGIASSILNKDLIPEFEIYKNNQCGHYSLADGQHRFCVIARLKERGEEVSIDAEVINQNIKCYYCGLNDKFVSQEKALTFFDKVFRKKIKKLNISQMNHEKFHFIHTFKKNE